MTTQETAADRLRKYFAPGDTAHTILLHVSASGMSRHIAVIATEKNKWNSNPKQSVPVNVSGLVATLLDRKMNKGCTGIVIGGCGMDMGFEIVYSMGKALWPEGTDKPHSTRNGEPDSDGGYAIKHRWI